MFAGRGGGGIRSSSVIFDFKSSESSQTITRKREAYVVVEAHWVDLARREQQDGGCGQANQAGRHWLESATSDEPRGTPRHAEHVTRLIIVR